MPGCTGRSRKIGAGQKGYFVDARIRVDVADRGHADQSEYRTRSSHGIVCVFRDISISTSFYTRIRVVRVLPLLWKRSGRRSTLARAASSAPATTARLKGDGSRSLFCRLGFSGISSDSAGSGQLGLVADVDGADYWALRRYERY